MRCLELRRTAIVGLLLAALAIVATACGGGSYRVSTVHYGIRPGYAPYYDYYYYEPVYYPIDAGPPGTSVGFPEATPLPAYDDFDYYDDFGGYDDLDVDFYD